MIPFSTANSKLVKERIWNNPVTRKIVLQPLESDTDAHLHEESVISVRIQAEVGISSSTRENVAGEMRTPWTLLVDVMTKSFRETSRSRRKLQRRHTCYEKPQVTQTMIRSKVQSIPKPDLEQTAAQSPGKMLQISSRQHTSLRERENESRKAPPD